MIGDWDVAISSGWLNHARLAADLVIVAAGVSVARVLRALLSRRKGPARAPRVLVAFAAMLALCGVSHLGVVLAGQVTIAATAPVVPIALKVAVASLWVVAAFRFRTVAAPLLRPAADAPERHAPTETERIETKVRRLEDVFNNEPWIMEKTDALRELREILADLEARQCQT